MQGNVTELIDITSQIVVRYRYDEESNLYYLQSRYYDPEIGRFISMDDVSFISTDDDGTINLYAYAANNPVMFTDSTGYFWGTIIDIGFAIWGLVDLINNPTWENAGWLALDLVSSNGV